MKRIADKFSFRLLSILFLTFFISGVVQASQDYEMSDFADNLTTEDGSVSVAIVLSDILSNKDMEFSRGFVCAMESLDAPDELPLNLKIINGQIPEDSLYNELMAFEPSMIISTFEKNSPSAILKYADDVPTLVINAFDVKGKEYKTYPHVFQYLTPSEIYNELEGNYIANKFADNALYILGEPESSDAILTTILSNLSGEVPKIKVEELEMMEIEPFRNYLFYVTSNNKGEIKDYLKILGELRDNYPLSSINIVGRSNWIAMTDLTPQFSQYDVFIPTKCYFDPSSLSARLFIDKYNELYGHNPIKSYPVYSVSGYDIANYFLPELLKAKTNGALQNWPSDEGLQSFMNFVRGSDDGGFYNNSCYLVKLSEYGGAEKFLIK